jgi:hypothetical protein
LAQQGNRATEEVRSAVPYGLRVGAAMFGCLLVITGGLAVVGFGAVQLATVLVPVAVALLLSGLLGRCRGWQGRRCPGAWPPRW